MENSVYEQRLKDALTNTGLKIKEVSFILESKSYVDTLVSEFLNTITQHKYSSGNPGYRFIVISRAINLVSLEASKGMHEAAANLAVMDSLTLEKHLKDNQELKLELEHLKNKLK